MGILGTSVSGINAAQLGLLTAEHNIANANTPGYTRQRTLQATAEPVLTGSGFLGQGTRVNTVERQYNAFLSNSVNQSQANASELGKYYDQISLIDNILADPNAGLSPVIQDFFRGVQQVAADPASMPARQAMVSSAQALSARFQSIESRLSEIYDGVDSQITSSVAEINSLASQIAELNQRIVVAVASTQQTPNDLLDQRDQLITDLNKQIRVSVVADPSGSTSVFVGNGIQLVVGSLAMTLGVQASSADASRTTVGVVTSSGGMQSIPESILAGGELGGLIKFRSESLDAAANGLGQVAAVLALTFNAQHALGQDLLGQIDGDAGFVADFFVDPVPSVIANTGNVSNAVISASFVAPTFGTNGPTTNITTSDYLLVAKGAGNFTLTRQSDGKTWGPNTIAGLNSILSNPADAAYDPQGFTLAATSGTAIANESFLIQPTRTIARNFALNSSVATDPRLIAAAAPIRGQLGSLNVGEAKIVSTSVGVGYAASAPALPITLTYDSATNSLSGFPVGSVVTPVVGGVAGAPITIVAPATAVPYQTGATLRIDGAVGANAFSLQIDGQPTGGDTFIIGRNTQGISDGRNILSLGLLQTTTTANGGTATYQAAYAQLVSNVGNRSRQTSVTRDAQEKLLEQATAARESQSGVNLDEEAANLIKYQQAYQASAKALSIASSLFDEIIALGR